MNTTRSDSVPWGWRTAIGLLGAHIVIQVGLGLGVGVALLTYLLLTSQDSASWTAWASNGVFIGATGILGGLFSLALIYAVVTRLRKRSFRATIGLTGRTRVWSAAFGAVLLGGLMDALTLALHQPIVPNVFKPWYVGAAATKASHTQMGMPSQGTSKVSTVIGLCLRVGIASACARCGGGSRGSKPAGIVCWRMPWREMICFYRRH